MLCFLEGGSATVSFLRWCANMNVVRFVNGELCEGKELPEQMLVNPGVVELIVGVQAKLNEGESDSATDSKIA